MEDGRKNRDSRELIQTKYQYSCLSCGKITWLGYTTHFQNKKGWINFCECTPEASTNDYYPDVPAILLFTGKRKNKKRL